ncbi:TetR/AcrR family transcriptional regulator [Actinoplanes sp. G11-F43]|uniref:TetR/AcrR family transcriptional regulator n=1 Tax=Actinoplanes sp. G11-F43 TaxID=3424130 RepID=UPI003D336DCB
MPGATAVRIADAALDVLGTGGIHALSHARVDAVAGLPAGSASNHFRTRAALVSGAVARLRELDAVALRVLLDAHPPADRDELAGVFAAFVADATGPSRVRTAARFVIFVQGVAEPSLLAELNEDRGLIVDWTAAVLGSLRVPGERQLAETLLATVEGLIMHRLTGFAADPVAPRLRRLLAG